MSALFNNCILMKAPITSEFPHFFQLQIKVVPVIVIISKCKAVCSLHFLYINKIHVDIAIFIINIS